MALRISPFFVLCGLLFACGETAVDSDHHCGVGTMWDGANCVVKPAPRAPAASPGPPSPGSQTNLGIAGKAPGPCAIVTKAGPVEKLVETGTSKTFTYDARGALTKMVTRYLDKNSPKGFDEATWTYHYDSEARISKIHGDTAMGTLEARYAYGSNGLAATQRLSVIKSFGTTETDWQFSYDASLNLSKWTWHDSQGEGETKTVNLRADGPAKRVFDCDAYVAGVLVQASCWYEYDDRSRVSRFVSTHQGKTLSERAFVYEGDRYVEWQDREDNKRVIGSRITYDNYGNVAYIDWSSADTLPTIERQVYDYACWVGNELPQAPAACAGGGKPDAFSAGTCFERLTSASLQVY